MPEFESDSGLTAEERVAMSHLVAFWNAWTDLETTHPHDTPEVMASVHAIQGVMASRLARRHYPKYWTTVKERGRALVARAGDIAERAER